MTPATARTLRCRSRKARTRSAIRRPASAKNSSGIAVPTPKATVSATVCAPIFPVAPATVIAASTGPAHGTYTAPRASPRMNPPCSPVTRSCGIRAKGRSSSSSTRGKSIAIPSRTSTTRPAQRMMSCGSGSALSTRVPSSVMRLKLNARPATIEYGRSRARRAAFSRSILARARASWVAGVV